MGFTRKGEEGMKMNRNTGVAAFAVALMGVPVMQWASASTMTWTNGDADSSWNNTNNWNTAKPGTNDEAEFTNTGTSGATVTLDASQVISQLTLDTTNSFIIGSADDKTAGNTLTLTDVSRSSTSSGTQTIGAGVVLGGASQWTVDGVGSLMVTGGIGGETNTLEKLGAGTLVYGANPAAPTYGVNNTYTGLTTVTAGTLTLGVSAITHSYDAITGNLTIGGGTNAAKVNVGGTGSRIKDTAVVTIDNNGTLDFTSTGSVAEGINNVEIKSGGTLKLKDQYQKLVVGSTLTLNDGATVSSTNNLGRIYMRGSTVTVNAPANSVVVGYNVGLNRSSAPVNFNVGDGAAVFDLVIGQGMGDEPSYSGGFAKQGDGVMVLNGTGGTYSRTYYVSGTSGPKAGTFVNAGTLLANNSAGSATGANAVQVNDGGTLGGNGSISGDVTLTGAISAANLSPGTLDATTGNSLAGTLAVGNTTFQANSHLISQIGNAGVSDLLAVTGDLDLSNTGDVLDLSILPSTTPSGVYTLATFTGTLTGTFNTVNGLPANYSLQYLDASHTPIDLLSDASTIVGGGSIVLTTVPEPGSIFGVAALAGAALLRRRRQRIV